MRHRRLWLRVLVGGLALWLIIVATLWFTQAPNLVPSVYFVGSFLIPVTSAIWFYEREQFSGAGPSNEPSALLIPLLATAFVGAGLLGVAGSEVLETVLLGPFPRLFYPGVAIIEETVKLVLVWILARNLPYYTRRDGMVLGACVGFGFAAFESAGYAFSAVVQGQSHSSELLAVVETQLVRSLLTPVGHGLWTALLAGALFASARNGKLRLSANVAAWWLAVVILHMIWDASTGLAIMLTSLSTGQRIDLTGFQTGQIPNATATQAHLIAVYSWALLSLCALLGAFLAHREWVKGRTPIPSYPSGPAGSTSP